MMPTGAHAIPALGMIYLDKSFRAPGRRHQNRPRALGISRFWFAYHLNRLIKKLDSI
jgi:hypothetical protein